MYDFIELVEKFEGIIGALFGVIITMILTQWLKSLGKTRFYLVSSEFKYMRDTVNDFGETRSEHCEKVEADNLQINCTIEIYNSSEIHKILRDVKFSFYDGGKMLLNVTPEDKETEQRAKYWTIREELLNINIPPKQIITIELIRYIGEQYTETIKQCNRVMLTMKNHNGKKHKINIAEI